MIRKLAWAWLIWKHRGAVRQGLRRARRYRHPVTLAGFDALIKTVFVEPLRGGSIQWFIPTVSDTSDKLQ